ncbi:hypothetical protein [Paraburkholderia adhaesiva]|uniref:hypothetical protein n=1 Tax=Paraburkholderia adhaesiva TaxID=2883244 RepID=UPI001F2D8BF8|nr:hypothetical protein [Paraburkholderia adhaesiva]
MALEPGTQRVIAWTKAGCPLPGEAAYDEFMRQRDGSSAAGVQPTTPETARSESATPSPREVSDGALRSRSGGLYLPWGPYLSADDVRRMRAELVAMLEELSTLERWPRELLDDTMARAIRAPLADLLPNLHYFRARLKAMRVQAATSAEVANRTWRANEDLTNRGYPEHTATAATKKRTRAGRMR